MRNIRETIQLITAVLLWTGLLSAENNDIIHLELFEGTESILLVWEAEENAVLIQTNVYRKTDFQSPFQLLTQIHSDTKRFCDDDLNREDRYFYKVQLLYESGIICESQNEIPPFGRLLPVREYPDYLENDTSLRNLTEAEWFELVLKTGIAEQFPLLNPEEVSQLTDLLQKKVILKHPWIDLFIQSDHGRFTSITNTSIQSNILTEINRICMDAETLVRNQIGLTPDEWNSARELQTERIAANLKELSFNFNDEVKFYQSLPPLWITRFTPSENENLLQLRVIDPASAADEYYVLSRGDQHVNIPLNSFTEKGDTILMEVPGLWDKASLMGQYQVFQIIPLTSEETYSISLDGEFILGNTQYQHEASPIWINEWIVDPAEDYWSVEITGQLDSESNYAIMIEDKILWEIDPVYLYESSFFDSTFSLKMIHDRAKWVHLKQQNQDDEWIILESRFLENKNPVQESRYPDGGKWSESQSQTLGMSNASVKQSMDDIIIPEIFALYQNYPNPFNNHTTIFFDMIEPAIIDLYITDATGRVIEVFLEDESLSKGSYNFKWEAFQISSGVYFITITAQAEDYPPIVFSRKMIYLK